MLVVALGTQASGSTWAFNVIRALFALIPAATVSLSADECLDMADNMPLDVDHVILKAHALDLRLLRLMASAGAKLIVTTRDPRDSIVSQRERFSQPMPSAATDLSRSLTTIAMLPPRLPRLTLCYEHRFTERPETVGEIAHYLGFVVSEAQCRAIFERYTPDAVNQQILRRRDDLPGGEPWVHDPETQWHPGHVGDGKVGKWTDRLSGSDQDVVCGCLMPLFDGSWRTAGLRWSSSLFRYSDQRVSRRIEELNVGSSDDLLVYGPYLHLPVGRWRAVALVDAIPRWRSTSVKLDIHLPDTGRNTVAEKVIRLPSKAPDAAVEFDVEDHFRPVEMRLASTHSREGRLRFLGAQLTWLGECQTLSVMSFAPVARHAGC